MKNYIKQLEKVIDKKMKSPSVNKKEIKKEGLKGFMTRQSLKTETTKETKEENIIDVVADLVISIREERMEYKNAKDIS
tara:strand:- start:795 stop:1031 length:237 start_codon:yes stop_codon:yes gene_type:complete